MKNLRISLVMLLVLFFGLIFPIQDVVAILKLSGSNPEKDAVDNFNSEIYGYVGVMGVGMDIPGVSLEVEGKDVYKVLSYVTDMRVNLTSDLLYYASIKYAEGYNTKMDELLRGSQKEEEVD